MAKSKATTEELSTRIATIPASEFASLSATGNFKESMDAMAATGETLDPTDLVRVKNPTAGRTQFEIPGAGPTEHTSGIEGILVYWQRCGLLWPSGDAIEGMLPVLRTWDLVTAEQIGPIPDDMIESLQKHQLENGKYDWVNLPYNQWGTGKDGVGKRCKEYRMIYLLRATDAFPLLITAGVGSLRVVTQWFKQIPQLKIPYFRCVVRIGLEPAISKNGTKYARFVPSVIGSLSPEDGEAVRATWTNQIAKVATHVTVDSESSADE